MKTSDFVSFALTASDEAQSKAPFNTQSLAENKTDGYRIENRFFHR